jgi:hypothetical protein
VIQDVDAFNRRLVAERDGWSLDQILAELEVIQAALVELVDGMSDRELSEIGRFWGPYWDSVAEWLHVAWEHEEKHATQIHAWREQACSKWESDFEKRPADKRKSA